MARVEALGAAPAPVVPSNGHAPAQVEPEPDPIEALGAELDEAEIYADIERAARARLADWPQLRRAILANGGIGPSPDWPRDWYPADLYRVNGPKPDVVAAETRIGAQIPWATSNDGELVGNDAAMFEYLQRSWADWQALQQERRPRARVKPEPSPAPAVALRAPAPASERDLVLDVARVVADVADLVAGAATDSERRRFAALAGAARDLARMVAT